MRCGTFVENWLDGPIELLSTIGRVLRLRESAMHLDGNKALLPDSFGVSFPLALLSLICWGSWTNTRKAVPEEDVKFPHYYMDYSLGL